MATLNRLFTGRMLRRKIADSRDRLYGIALAWCGDVMVADDLVQETLVLALQRIGQLRDPKCLNAWLHTILSNCWKQYLRRKHPGIDLDELCLSGDDDPQANSSELELVELVRNAIFRLPYGQRQTVTLVDLSGFSYAEVAQILDIPVGTVMSRLHNARRTLQKTLSSLHAATPGDTAYIRRIK